MADYFPRRRRPRGEALGVDKSRRFSGLSGYKKVIDSGVEAAVLEVPPDFLPEHATAAAAEAGLHVYMAKPVAVDVPGCLPIEAAGKLATRKQARVLRRLPDPHRSDQHRSGQADPRGGDRPASPRSLTFGTGGHEDPPDGQLESRLQERHLGLRHPLGGDYVVRRPCRRRGPVGHRQAARRRGGRPRISRPNPHGDSPTWPARSSSTPTA